MSNTKDTPSGKQTKKSFIKSKKTLFGIIIIAAIATTIAVVTNLSKQPVLKDGKYCEVTGNFKNLSGSIIYNDYFCIEVANKKTYTSVTVSEKPAALKMQKSYEATYEFDFGKPIEIKNDNGDMFTIEQIDDKTVLFKKSDGSVKIEASTDVIEDHENQADKK